MGWNSWDSYGTTVREEQVKANADWMAEHLAKYGWQYIVVDVQWYEPNAHQMLERGDIRVWVADSGSAGERYVAAFNLGEKTETLEVEWSEVGIAGRVSEVRDLWTHVSLGGQRSLRAELKPHASMLYRVTTKSN